jgi:hypothetical protein
MTSFQSACVVIFGILAYLIWVDENIAVYLTLIFKIIKINTERMFWMIKLHPYNPITNLIMKWKYDKIAKEIIKELNVIENDKLSNSN